MCKKNTYAEQISDFNPLHSNVQRICPHRPFLVTMFFGLVPELVTVVRCFTKEQTCFWKNLGEGAKGENQAQRHSKEKHVLINEPRNICFPYCMCMYAHRHKCRERRCRVRKQTTDKGTSGKGSGTYVIGILIIRMRFCVTYAIFKNTPNMRTIKIMEFHGVIVIDNNVSH